MQVAQLSQQRQSTQVAEVIPSGKGCGAEVRGVDLRNVDSKSFGVIEKAVLEHLVVLIRGQSITDPELIAFGKRFGELEPPGMSIIGKPYIDEHPDILVISNIVENGQPQGNLGAGEAIWHTDMSYREKPVTYAILHSLEVPPTGGNTYFANQYRAYDTLSDELKKKLDGRLVIHDETYNNYYTAPDVKVLLTTDHPKNDPELAWGKTYGKSRVFYLMLGHDGQAYGNPSYAKLVQVGIRWAAGTPQTGEDGGERKVDSGE